jgi:hypothetical protein
MTARGSSPNVVTAGGCGGREIMPSPVFEAARAGDADGFLVICGPHRARLRGPAFLTIGDPDLIDDAMPDRASAGTRGREASS